MQLHRFRQEFDSRHTQVLLIGFEGQERSQAWLRKAQVDFPFLIDREREVYRAYGLERSIFRAWHPRVLWFYFKRFLRGKGIPIFRADPAQLGADILIDREGRIRMRYFSKDSMDRPSIEHLISAMDNL